MGYLLTQPGWSNGPSHSQTGQCVRKPCRTPTTSDKGRSVLRMVKFTRSHLSYANVTATLALVFSMSGGALAANHYLINSSRQINPRVLKKLRGETGPQG